MASKTLYVQGDDGQMRGSRSLGGKTPPAENELAAAEPVQEELALFDYEDATAKIAAAEWSALKTQMEPHGKIMLGGVVGSTAYGLNHKDSDRDRLGIFVTPTEELFSLHNIMTPADILKTVLFKEPTDAQFHEVGKFVKLSLSGNPAVTELLWLNEYEALDPFARKLVQIRRDLLSGPRILGGYLGFAYAQMKKIEHELVRGDAEGRDGRIRKHAMHLARLTRQGEEIYTTGSLTVKVADPGWYREFRSADLDTWKQWFEESEAKFREAETVLPEKPRVDRVTELVKEIRWANLPDRLLPPF